MHYRKITVNGKTYEYVVGRWDTKVKGVGLFPNREWTYCINAGDGEFMVSPYHVEGMILGLNRAGHHPLDSKPEKTK